MLGKRCCRWCVTDGWHIGVFALVLEKRRSLSGFLSPLLTSQGQCDIHATLHVWYIYVRLVFTSCLQSERSTEKLWLRFAFRFEDAIWPSLPTSVVVCVSRCCGRRRQWQEILPDSKNQKVLTDWPSSSWAASEAWPLTCLLPRRAYDRPAGWTSWTATGRPTDDVCRLSIRREGIWMMWGGGEVAGGQGGRGRLSTRLK